MKTEAKLWPLKLDNVLKAIWPSDLVFDPTWPIFKLDWDIVKMIILSKLDEDWSKTVASRVFTRFFYDLTYWPSFWPDMTHIWTWLRYYQDKHSDKFSWWLDGKCGLYRSCSQGLSMIWPTDLVFHPTWPILELD